MSESVKLVLYTNVYLWFVIVFVLLPTMHMVYKGKWSSDKILVNGIIAISPAVCALLYAAIKVFNNISW